MKLRFGNVVWGRKFTTRFLEASLPSHLSPNNLPYVARHADCVYRIYTTSVDANAIRRSDSYAALSSIMPVEIAEISGLALVGRYSAMTQCDTHFLRSHASDDVALVMANPDWIWSDGAAARLLELALAGKRLVAMTTPRVAAETFLPEYLARFGGGHTVSARDLIRLALDHLHPITVTRLWETKGLRSCAGEMWWAVGDEGLLARQFHLHPILVRPVDREVMPKKTIDADYITAMARDWQSIHIVQDSDDLCILDFTSLSTSPGEATPDGNTIDDVVKWARASTLLPHREFVLRPIRFHWKQCSSAWVDVERRSAAVVAEILGRLALAPVRAEAPSRMRYLRPGFWMSKVRSVGVRYLARVGWSRVLQRIGSAVGRSVIGIRLSTEQ